MQLMPQTAERTARGARLPFEGPDALERPEVNIRIGTLHLAELLRELEGRPSLALAAYNAGKPPLSRWLQRYGFRDEEEFIEDIPYSETRNYVKRVLGSHERYAAVYGAEGAERGAPGTEQGAPRTEGEEPSSGVRGSSPPTPEP
jgi:soluble lytic murein transglycosylase